MRSRTLRLVLVAALAALATALVLTTASGAKSDKRDGGKSSKSLKANLNGANEVNAEGVGNQGDPDGSGRARVELLPRFNAVCWKVKTEDIAPGTRGHIHRGAKGVNGPIVVEFFEADSVADRGCTDGLDPDLIREIKRNPSGFYVNIHNAEFPAGAIRGQLKKKSSRGRHKKDDK